MSRIALTALLCALALAIVPALAGECEDQLAACAGDAARDKADCEVDCWRREGSYSREYETCIGKCIGDHDWIIGKCDYAYGDCVVYLPKEKRARAQ
jgi:hypothetical protein